MDFFVLPIHGAYIVLGNSWLVTLGPNIIDYRAQIFEFTLGDRGIRWFGEPPTNAQPLQLQTLHWYSVTDSISSYYCLMIVQNGSTINFDHRLDH